MPDTDPIAELEQLMHANIGSPSHAMAFADQSQSLLPAILAALKQAKTDRECRDEHESQLVRIAQVFGKDARHGPDGDPTIAGMVAKEVERKSERIRELEAFARECAKDWDCDSDAHRYGTVCRSCKGADLLTKSI